MSEWILIRWCIAIPLALLWLLCFLGHVSSIITVISRGVSTSVIPFIGGAAGAFAVLICPAVGIRHWFWLPLLLDIGAFTILASILSHRGTKRREAHEHRARRGA